VHAAVLRQSSALAMQCERNHGFRTAPSLTAYLTGIDEQTAHVLVHYLYTKRYEALELMDEAENSRAQPCALAIRVYFAGIKYGLPGLLWLAQEQIIVLGAQLGIEELLGAVRECAFPVLSEKSEGRWFEKYLEARIKAAVMMDAELVTSAGFVASFEGNSRLLQIVWRTVMAVFKPCAPAVEERAEREEGEVQGNDGEAAHGRDDGDYIPLTPALSAPDSVPTANDALHLDTIEPADSLTASSEHGSHGLGSYQQSEPVGDVGSPASSLQVLEDGGMTPHARSDSVVQVGDAAVASDGLVRNDLEQAGESLPEPEVVSKKMSKKERKMKELREKRKKLALLPMGV
jgi:hypothetical protein